PPPRRDRGVWRRLHSTFLPNNQNPPPGPNSPSYSPEPPRVLKLPGRPDHLQRPEEWKTPALWGVADSAPYFHDGASPTLDSAITRHRGDAKNVTARYEELGSTGKSALIAFLKTLKAPPDAVPLSNPGVTRVRK